MDSEVKSETWQIRINKCYHASFELPAGILEVWLPIGQLERLSAEVWTLFEVEQGRFDFISTSYTIGETVGALLGSAFTRCRKWNMIMASNFCVFFGYVLCVTLIDGLFVAAVGRFIIGLAIGGYSTFCPKFVNESTPIELRGPTGVTSQVMVSVG